MSHQREEDDDRVGYGKPPKHSRFQKGQSGNPGGRPRKPRSLKAAIRRRLDQITPVRINGETRHMSMREALVEFAIQSFREGRVSVLKYLLELDQESADFQEQAERDGAEIDAMLTADKLMERKIIAARREERLKNG